MLPLLPPTTLDVRAFETVGDGAAGPHAVGRFDEAELVQFTSGSTSDPKGVVLGITEVEANIVSILDAIEPRPSDVACSWLPLSHDMGLIGMTLTALCSGGRRFVNGGEAILIPPEFFLRRPESWLEACSEFGATITAAPDFGFSHAVRRGTNTEIDLSRLRVCITGAEPVRATTLRTFRDTFASSGFDEVAFSPAYGLAEAGVAVTLTRPLDHWRSVTVDPRQLDNGSIVATDEGTELVSAGTPLDGYQVRASGSAPTTGPLQIDGPSLLRSYVPGAPRADGWFDTNDIGFVKDGHLYVVGRADDVVLLAGRNVFLSDVERAVADNIGVAGGRLHAIRTDDGYALVIERDAGSDVDGLASRIRNAAVSTTGWTPSLIVVTDRGCLPKTPSGKPRRRELARQIEDNELVVLHQKRLQTR